MIDAIASAGAVVTLHRGVPVVVVSGELDASTVERVRVRVFDELERCPRGLVVDMAGVTFFGSIGLQLLVEAIARARRTGTTLVLAASHRAVLNPLALTELDRAVPVCGSVDDAVGSVLVAHKSDAV